MYSICKTFEFAASHKLTLPYDSPCQRSHGHNYKVEVTIEAKRLNEQGMVVDFSHVKALINNLFDHRNLDDTLAFTPELDRLPTLNSTAERMSHFICHRINAARHDKYFNPEMVCTKVTVWETPTSSATYTTRDNCKCG